MGEVVQSLLRANYDSASSAISLQAETSEFVFCTAFSIPLPNINSNCPSFSDVFDDEDEDDDAYIAIATFGIFADDKLMSFKRWISNELSSENFKLAFANQMNLELENISTGSVGGRRRRRGLLQTYNSFTVSEIEVVDANNATSDDGGNEAVTEGESQRTVLIVVAVVAAALLISVAVAAFVCQRKMHAQFPKEGSVNAEPEPEAGQNEREGAQAQTQSVEMGQAHHVGSASGVSLQSVGDKLASNIMVRHSDEFMVTFATQPFGMNLSTLKTDKYNLYVSKVEGNSIAARNNVTVGLQLVAINGESVEGIGSILIFQRVREAELPAQIMFRKRKKQRRKTQSVMEGVMNAKVEQNEQGIARAQTEDDHEEIVEEVNRMMTAGSDDNDVVEAINRELETAGRL